MLAVWDGVVLGNLCIGIFIIWRLFQIQERLDQKISDIDKSLGVVVGLIIEKIGRIPVENEKIRIQNLIFSIAEVTKLRIVCLLVSRAPEETEVPGQSLAKADKSEE